MKIASWNVNSLRVRLPQVLDWLQRQQPDILALQETKLPDDQFPLEPLQEAGYTALFAGQKSYNGVALLSRSAASGATITDLPGMDDPQRRVLGAAFGELYVLNLYVPNGQAPDSDKFDYKLAWMERLYDHAARLLKLDEAFVLGGGYNVCPTDDDVYDPAGWANDALCRSESRGRFRALLNLGLTDAVRALHVDGPQYTYWDYQAGAWQKNNGIRIDHLLLSPQAADRLKSARGLGGLI